MKGFQIRITKTDTDELVDSHYLASSKIVQSLNRLIKELGVTQWHICDMTPGKPIKVSMAENKPQNICLFKIQFKERPMGCDKWTSPWFGYVIANSGVDVYKAYGDDVLQSVELFSDEVVDIRSPKPKQWTPPEVPDGIEE